MKGYYINPGWNGRAPAPPIGELSSERPSPINWTREILDLQPDPFQQQILEHPGSRILVCAGRQCGKSTIAAARVLYEAVHFPGCDILLAAPVGRQSVELLEKVRTFAASAGLKLKGLEKSSGVRLPNQSRIIALPGKLAFSIRGYTPRLIAIDEAAWVSDSLHAVLHHSLAASKGTILQISTPNGTTGRFYSDWHDHLNSWTRFHITGEACTRIGSAFLAEVRQRFGEETYRQEVMCEFLSSQTQAIPRDIIARAMRDDIEPFFPRTLWK